MRANAYEDVHDLSSDVLRERECLAFDQGLALLEAAKGAPGDREAAQRAVRHLQTLWGFLIRDLSNPANDLSDDLKTNLVSIGLWVMRETDAILAGTSDNWTALIEINTTVREGLST